MNAHSTYKDRQWEPQPGSEHALNEQLKDLLGRLPEAKGYARRLLQDCAVRLRDIVDHFSINDDQSIVRIEAAGWISQADGSWRNANGLFPDFLCNDQPPTVWIRVEDIDTFRDATSLELEIEGQAHGTYRRAIAFANSNARLGVVERSGHVGYDIPTHSDAKLQLGRRHLQAFRARRRQFDSIEQGLTHTEALVDAAVADLGQHWACDLWFRAEREYWMRRCIAGREQKLRQDKAGIGLSNIDHHTYDSSRAHYRQTIRILEKLGYELREMLYAGELAGWGSQVLEQPALRSTIFADVDLAPEELAVDFAHDELPVLEKHRRAGVLSFIHGESILEAGLNHVAGLHDWRAFNQLQHSLGVTMMPPFSEFDHLYQELTEGDWGAVDPTRVDILESQGHISPEEAAEIRNRGAIITHYENIERNDGFKGFNRLGIDQVLRKLDPRAYTANHAQ